VIGKRKERLSTKCDILKGKFLVSTEEIQEWLAEAKRKTNERKGNRV
jgi:hypothetical protein